MSNDIRGKSPQPRGALATTLQRIITRLTYDPEIMFNSTWDFEGGLDGGKLNDLVSDLNRGPIFGWDRDESRGLLTVHHFDSEQHEPITWTVWAREHSTSLWNDKKDACARGPRFAESLDHLRSWIDADTREIAEKAETASQAIPEPLPSKPQKKKSTVRGEGKMKLIAALTKHHRYSDGRCMHTEPIGNNELAEMVTVSGSTASDFFKKQFEGHTKYKALCRDSGKLAAALRLLNGEFSPHVLFGRRPADEDGRDGNE